LRCRVIESVRRLHAGVGHVLGPARPVPVPMLMALTGVRLPPGFGACHLHKAGRSRVRSSTGAHLGRGSSGLGHTQSCDVLAPRLMDTSGRTHPAQHDHPPSAHAPVKQHAPRRLENSTTWQSSIPRRSRGRRHSAVFVKVRTARLTRHVSSGLSAGIHSSCLRDAEVPGSNPGTPTEATLLHTESSAWLSAERLPAESDALRNHRCATSRIVQWPIRMAIEIPQQSRPHVGLQRRIERNDDGLCHRRGM